MGEQSRPQCDTRQVALSSNMRQARGAAAEGRETAARAARAGVPLPAVPKHAQEGAPISRADSSRYAEVGSQGAARGGRTGERSYVDDGPQDGSNIPALRHR